MTRHRRAGGDDTPDPVLIRFDRRVRTFLGLLLLLLAVGTVFKLHGSSICIWNRQHPDRTAGAGVLFGTPHAIRSDEWAFMTPAIVSQARAHPPLDVSNPRWGPGTVPLIADLPTRHWSLPARPQFWGFLALGVERAFAFYWNMKAFLLVSGVFLLLALLTQNDFWVSLLGAGWIFFSGYVQWWYSTPPMLPETVGCFALFLVAAHYVALASRRSTIALASVVAAACLLDAALAFYPPYQVVLGYLGAFILAGSLGARWASGAWRPHLAFRIACAASTVLVVGALLFAYYLDAKPTIDVMRATVYPGSRVSPGGDLNWARVFGGFYGFFMTEGSYPIAWGNVCEASNFVLLFPVPVALVLWRTARDRRWSPLEWSLIAYLLVLLSWLTLGWPRSLASASGLWLTHGSRALLGIGLASIFLCCIHLARRRSRDPGGSGPPLVVAALWVVFLALFGLHFDRAVPGFATVPRILVVCLVAGAAGTFLATRKPMAFAACILVPNILVFGLVNPLAVGLGPLLETKFFQDVSRLVATDPDARWTVYGSHVAADLFKTAGANVFNGTKVVPPLDDLRVLDPGSAAENVYNRFAHVALIPAKTGDVRFKLLRDDEYTITIDPKSELWQRLGIRYVALPYAATDGGFIGKTELVLPLPGVEMWIYRYR